MSDRINVICGDCYYYINEEMRGNTALGGGVRAGDCHGVAPVVEKGWPVVEPLNIGCRHWKKGGILKSVIGPSEIISEVISKVPAEVPPIIIEDGMADPGINPTVGMPPMEEPCQSTNTPAMIAGWSINSSLRP